MDYARIQPCVLHHRPHVYSCLCLLQFTISTVGPLNAVSALIRHRQSNLLQNSPHWNVKWTEVQDDQFSESLNIPYCVTFDSFRPV